MPLACKGWTPPVLYFPPLPRLHAANCNLSSAPLTCYLTTQTLSVGTCTDNVYSNVRAYAISTPDPTRWNVLHMG